MCQQRLNPQSPIELLRSTRSYVTGRSACVGLSASVHQQPQKVIGIVRNINARIGEWCGKHAPKGYGWTTLQINVNTVSDWHKDRRNLGPSCLMVLGSYEGGAIEIAGFRPRRLQNAVVLMNGREWHRTNPVWEGDRVSV